MVTGQRTSPKSEKTRKTLLEAALARFGEDGFEKTTMRDIAKEAGLSLGAFYYYFKSKDEIVLAFYAQTNAEAAEANPGLVAQSQDFAKRFRAMLEFNLSQLKAYRSLVSVLARHGTDRQSPLSPFSAETKAIRETAIAMIEECISGSNLKVPRQLRPHLAKLLWLYQLGIVLYWTNDTSRNQEKTGKLMALSLPLLVRMLKLSSLPMLRQVNRTVIDIVGLIQS